MLGKTCLVTGGAGFIGCALSTLLAETFETLVVVDNLHPQVHPSATPPDSLDPRAKFVLGDVTEESTWDGVLAEYRPDVIIHLAAETGTGQSLSEAARHGRVNVVGTTVMLDALVRFEIHPRHIVLSSSRAVYGDGAWQGEAGRVFYPGQRTRALLDAGTWDHEDGHYVPASHVGTVPHPTSVYGATKLAQEHILEAWCTAFDSRLSILRFQNVYGPGQSLINSYTGIVVLFARLAREGKSIPLYEDGQMIRDFVFIDDVARAIRDTVKNPPPSVRRVDIGSGIPTTIATVATFIANHYKAPDPVVCGRFRHGDVRHASCDPSGWSDLPGWQPRVALEEGLTRLVDWIEREGKL